MQAGNLVGGDVLSFTTRILVNGVQRYGSWNTDRELSGDLPAQVVAVSGVTQATGSVTWFREADVTGSPMQPWNSPEWLPKRGDRVEIFVGDGVSEWKLFHGLIDRTTGSTGGGFQSTLIDDYDRTSADVEHQALLRSMPPLALGGVDPYRSIGLHPLYFVDYALRAARFYSTPNREYDNLLYAPMQGSWWPHYGLLESTSGSALNTVTPWGLGRSNGGAVYLPAKNPVMGTTVQMSVLIAPGHTGAADFYLDYGNATDHIRLSVNSARTAIALVRGVEVCRVVMGAGTVVSLLAKSGTISLRTDKGATASGTFTTSGSGLSKIRVNTDANASIGGFQASLPATATHEHSSTTWVASARLDATSVVLSGIIDASPAIEDKTAADLLDEIGKATLSAMWIDETGVFQWVPSDALRGRTPVRTVTTLDDVLSLDWEDGLLSTASKVTVKYQRPSITKSRWRTTVLSRGGGSQSLKSQDEAEIFLEPESGTHWIMPSYDFLEVGGTVGIWGSANQPEYSLVGMYFSADGGETELIGLSATITTAQLGPQKALVKYVAGSWPSDVEGVLKTSPTNTNLWPKNRDMELPRLVGRGLIEYIDQKAVATGAGGPGPELVHDAGVWMGRTDSNEIPLRVADYIAGQTAVPEPVITGLSIVPDPRLQLGDVINIQSDLFGVTLTALITNVSTGHDTSGLSMELGVRVINVARDSMTYAQYDQTINGNLSYAQWQALGPVPQSYAEFNNE